MSNEIRYNLDTSTINYIGKRVKQLDDRICVINLTDKGIPFVVTGATLILKAMRADETFITQTTGITIASNVVTIAMDRRITEVSGEVKLELKITLAGKDISTFTFMIEVEPSVLEGGVAGGSVITALEDLDTTIASAIATNVTLGTTITTATGTNTALTSINTVANGTKNALNTSITNGTTSKTNLDASVVTANTTKTNLDTSNVTANTTKTNLDTSNTTANTTKTALNTSITNANNTKTALEVAIANGDTATMKTRLDNKVNKWNELEYTSLTTVPANLAPATLVFGQTSNGTTLGTFNTVKNRFTFTEAGKYLIMVDSVFLLNVGRTASVGLWIDSIRECRGVQTNILGIDGGNNLTFSFSAFKSIGIGGYIELEAVHNSTSSTGAACNVKIIKLIE